MTTLPPPPRLHAFQSYVADSVLTQRALYEYTGGLRPILEQSLTREEQNNHWYGVFMGTLPEHRRKGLGSSML